jgi:signal peptidase I
LTLDFVRFLGVLHVTTNYGINFTLCIGPSMMPTFREEGDVCLIDTFSYAFGLKEYKKGDVVICTCPYNHEKTVCKRIGGTEGDIFHVNQTYGGYSGPIIVPKGHVWLLGDNVHNSTGDTSPTLSFLIH